MLDRRNFLGFAATATAATAVGLAVAPTIPVGPGQVVAPELEDATVSSRHRRQRSMRQATVEGAGTPNAGSGQGSGVHPRRAARERLGSANEANVTLAEADVTHMAGRNGRGARALSR